MKPVDVLQAHTPCCCTYRQTTWWSMLPLPASWRLVLGAGVKRAGCRPPPKAEEPPAPVCVCLWESMRWGCGAVFSALLCGVVLVYAFLMKRQAATGVVVIDESGRQALAARRIIESHDAAAAAASNHKRGWRSLDRTTGDVLVCGLGPMRALDQEARRARASNASPSSPNDRQPMRGGSLRGWSLP